MRILGLDPGLNATGFGAISSEGALPSMLTCGCIKTSPSEDVPQRLFQIRNDLLELLGSVRPDAVAVENVFSLVRYPKAGILLGSVLGIIYVSVLQLDIPLAQISPREVKNSLAGYGAADKQQMKLTVKKLLRLTDIKSTHAADALAVALTFFYRNRTGKRK